MKMAQYYEIQTIEKKLKEFDYDCKLVSKSLGYDETTLNRKIKKYGILSKPQWVPSEK